jgi:hypothetical protein
VCVCAVCMRVCAVYALCMRVCAVYACALCVCACVLCMRACAVYARVRCVYACALCVCACVRAHTVVSLQLAQLEILSVFSSFAFPRRSAIRLNDRLAHALHAHSRTQPRTAAHSTQPRAVRKANAEIERENLTFGVSVKE